MVGTVTQEASARSSWSALESVTTRSHGSLKAAWIWLEMAPGVKHPAIGVVVVNSSTAHWPVILEETPHISAGFSLAATAQAASNSFPQIFRFMM